MRAVHTAQVVTSTQEASCSKSMYAAWFHCVPCNNDWSISSTLLSKVCLPVCRYRSRWNRCIGDTNGLLSPLLGQICPRPLASSARNAMTAEGACSYLRSAHVYGAAPAATARAKPPRAPSRPPHAAGQVQAAVPTQSVPLQPAKSAKARPASASISRTFVNGNASGRRASAGADRQPLYYEPVASISHDADIMASVLAYIATIPIAATTESSKNSSSSPSTLQCAPEPAPEPVARCSFDASMSCIAEEEASRAATATHSDSQSAAVTAAAAIARRYSSEAPAGAACDAITPLALDAFTAYRPSLDDATAALDVRGGSVVAAIAAARRTEGQALQRRRRRSAAASAAAAVAAAGSTASSSSTSSSGLLAQQLAGANGSEHVSAVNA
jgi:hypothetical protein